MALSGSAGGEYRWPQRRFCGDYTWPATVGGLSSFREVKAAIEEIGKKLKQNSALPKNVEEPQDSIAAWYPPAGSGEVGHGGSGATDWEEREIKEMFGSGTKNTLSHKFPVGRLFVGSASTGTWKLWVTPKTMETAIPQLKNINVTRLYDTAEPEQSSDIVRWAIKKVPKQEVGIVGAGNTIEDLRPAIRGRIRLLEIPGSTERISTNSRHPRENLVNRVVECRRLKHLTDTTWTFVSKVMTLLTDSREYRESLSHAAAYIAVMGFRAQKDVVDVTRKLSDSPCESWNEAWNRICNRLSGTTCRVYRNGDVELESEQEFYHEVVHQLRV